MEPLREIARHLDADGEGGQRENQECDQDSVVEKATAQGALGETSSGSRMQDRYQEQMCRKAYHVSVIISKQCGQAINESKHP